MKNNNIVYLLKLGGSLLTDKNKPFSLREDIIENSINQIIKSKEKLIIIHGGGSFGHPVAKKYNISKGLDPSIENQILGVAETHESMNKFNTYIINKFLEKSCPAISIQSSSIFLKKSREILTQSIETIETALDLGIIPVLYGDILLEKQGSFSIISGDQIILELCNHLEKYQVFKVIFAIEEDGIYIKENEKNKKLALNIKCNELDDLPLANLGQKIDVTGGIRGKINSIKEICKLRIPVQIINGIKENYIFKSLKNQDLECTYIKSISDEDGFKEIYDRKIEHLTIPLDYDVRHLKNYFKYINLIHHALPEIDLEEIDLSVDFFNKKISAPICISAITGGHPVAKKLNEILAKAAEEENIIMSVGSQRAGLTNPSAQESFSIVREVAPNIPIIGNIGIGQVCDPNFNIQDFHKCVKMIKADVMAIHINSLHELVQDGGDVSYKLFRQNFQKIRESSNVPIIAKEVGSGFNKEVALTLDKLGFDGFDAGGAGGTSFAAIEAYRNKNLNIKYTRNPGTTFREWGIPTLVSVANIRSQSKKSIIATGGLKTGIDIAKSLILGANVGGFAFKFLKTAMEDYKTGIHTNTIKEIKTLKNELRSSMWLLNLKNIEELKNSKDKIVIYGKLSKWLEI